MKAYIGLDIGGTKILGALYDETGNCLAIEKKKSKAHEGQDKVLQQIFKVIDRLLDSADNISLEAIGAGAPGIIKDESIIEFSPNLPFTKFDLGALIVDRYCVPFVLGNDVNVAMLGEWKHGKYSSKRHIVGLFVGTGVGGAIIINGELYTGRGVAGELGHMVINPEGETCGCGAKGCLEAYASKTGIQKAIVKAIDKGADCMLIKKIEAGEILKSSMLENAYQADDKVVVKAIDQAIDYLGIGLGNYINIFHPELFILGGGLIESLGEAVIPRIVARAKEVAMPSLMDDVVIQQASLGDDAGVFGAYQLAMTYKLK